MFSFKSPRRADLHADVNALEKAPAARTRKCAAMEAASRTQAEDKSRASLRVYDSSDSAPSSPLSIPSRHSSRSSSPATMRTSSRKHDASNKPRRTNSTRSVPQVAVPASVAAMLTMTAIPTRKAARKKPERSRRISIEELVQEWRTEAQSMPTSASHKSLELLLEPSEISFSDSLASSLEGYPMTSLSSRSSSSDSIPSLDMDHGSLLSLANPPTPDSPLNSRPASINTVRKTKQRPSFAEDCALDHPLLPPSPSSTASAETLGPFPSPKTPVRRKSTFKSNITLTLASLKSRLTPFSLSTMGPNPSYNPYSFSDATLWHHPHIFPRIGPEIRPEYDDPSAQARRYFNPPVPVTFEELESRYRQALHETASDTAGRGMIQMRTYTRPRVKQRAKSAPALVPVPAPPAAVDPTTELGRALTLPRTRAREPRENADFLRVVVLEMNMRRVGKLEDCVAGRARIWLPPRQGYAVADPARWSGVGVDDV